MNNNCFSVYELNSYIKDMFESNICLRDVYISGEISNYTHHFSGHMYFSLKDSKAKINCVMFKGDTLSLKFKPQNGQKVIIRGRISIYERDGKYQVYCVGMEPDGIGSLYTAYEQLRKKLQEEGLFDVARKKSLPFFPKRIGVVTSKTGAVIKDIINVSINRFKNVDILLYPAKVQGEGAEKTIIEGIEYFNLKEDVDVIIIGRGGGSIEELWAFNEESLARAIYKSEKPIISAVGHETDFTIADFVSDVRASTPSHAVEIVVPSLKGLQYNIETLENKILSLIKVKIKINKSALISLEKRLNILSPTRKLEENYQHLDLLHDKIINNFKSRVRKNRNSILILEKDITSIFEKELINKKSRFSNLLSKIDALSPINVLKRGYSFTKINGKVINSITKVKVEDILNINMIDGKVDCKVLKVMEGELWQEEKKQKTLKNQ